MASHDFFLTGAPTAARATISAVLQAQGYSVQELPTGTTTVASRGSKQKTFWLGAMAGRGFHVSFAVDYSQDAAGNLVARLNRDLTAGAFKGGAIGAAKTKTAFEELANALQAALAQTGQLAGSVANA
ncbi:hypothetical protein [Microbacterium tumbae]